MVKRLVCDQCVVSLQHDGVLVLQILATVGLPLYLLGEVGHDVGAGGKVDVAGRIEGLAESDERLFRGKERIGCLGNVFVQTTRGQSGWSGQKLTCKSMESGRQSLNDVLAKKASKNSGQLGEVKLLPRLESNGLGSDVRSVGVAVLSDVSADNDDDDDDDDDGVDECDPS